MAGAVFRSLLLLTAFVSGAVPQAPRSQHVKLSASIGSGTLQLVLRNTDSMPVTIVTGMRAGSGEYPAASFSFTIIFRDHSRSKLLCTTCEPAMIGGTMGLYVVTLKPKQAFHFEIPLVDFRVVDAKHNDLCTSETAGARLAVTLQGRQFNASEYSINHDVYWTGTASDTVLLSCS